MQLLQEEFFGKIYEFIKEIKVMPIRIIAKLIFYLIIIGIFYFVFWMIYTEKYVWVIVFIGMIVLGEIAHFIRKSREKEMNETIETKNEMKDEAKAPLNMGGLVIKKPKKKIGKVLNKEGLLPKK